MKEIYMFQRRLKNSLMQRNKTLTNHNSLQSWLVLFHLQIIIACKAGWCYFHFTRLCLIECGAMNMERESTFGENLMNPFFLLFEYARNPFEIGEDFP
ncbi:hypothetical protein MtrunA17_Chr3g0113731 [Medicago truncatula]|uniref:Uncharacterized protein n=1 Tax=Medicago truncatula TaxID=3880 RepID=A0A396IS73_MEDTR|nr:hypothetical protein MtrunA17_Chr3g0113731 [Medicago truncatula]